MKKKISSSQIAATNDDGDDDFQDANYLSLPLTQTCSILASKNHQSNKKPSNFKRPKLELPPRKLAVKKSGKENSGLGAADPLSKQHHANFQSSPNPMAVELQPLDSKTERGGGYSIKDAVPLPGEGLYCSLDSIVSTIDCRNSLGESQHFEEPEFAKIGGVGTEKMASKVKNMGYFTNSIESRLLKSEVAATKSRVQEDKSESEFEPGTQLDVLFKLCSEVDDEPDGTSGTSHLPLSEDHGCDDGPIQCPLCGTDISNLSDELRQVHTNECLDKEDTPNHVALPNDNKGIQCPGQVLDGSPVRSPRLVDHSLVLEWLRNLGLDRYEEVFVQQEIDWETLQWLTEEDLFSIGVTALGPRKKLLHAIGEIRKKGAKPVEVHTDAPNVDGITGKVATSRLITDYFPGSVAYRKKDSSTSAGHHEAGKIQSVSRSNRTVRKNHVINGKHKDTPSWCRIPGTPFRVDAFRYLRRDCSYWFLTHFHADHYQGLTKSFGHGKIYCSSITAKLVNMKIGIPWANIQVLPLNQKISIQGIDITCFDANHCPGSIIILFEPPNCKAVLHTGDFRFSDEMVNISSLQTCPIDTLILDTTYCDPQYDFPKQEAVIQFVIEAIQAEAFNPKTLFLIGSYTIGKERLFVEVARVLRKKIYVTAAKLRILECLGLPKEDMQWFTLNEHDSHIHVVPMWMLASFKRLKHLSNQYAGRFSLIVAFSPTGWSFGKGKKKTPGRRWQQGTVIRYEVPYSEHSCFSELREFVKFISPSNIIPSVNNNGYESACQMVSLLSA